MSHWLLWLRASHIHGWGCDAVGYTASALVLMTFCMKAMRPLRITAILSNFAFMTYAVLTGMVPILLLHGILLPVNVYRLLQLERHRRPRRGHAEAVALARPPVTSGH